MRNQDRDIYRGRNDYCNTTKQENTKGTQESGLVFICRSHIKKLQQEITERTGTQHDSSTRKTAKYQLNNKQQTHYESDYMRIARHLRFHPRLRFYHLSA